jgi:hypothetical protein
MNCWPKITEPAPIEDLYSFSVGVVGAIFSPTKPAIFYRK